MQKESYDSEYSYGNNEKWARHLTRNLSCMRHFPSPFSGNGLGNSRLARLTRQISSEADSQGTGERKSTVSDEIPSGVDCAHIYLERSLGYAAALSKR